MSITSDERRILNAQLKDLKACLEVCAGDVSAAVKNLNESEFDFDTNLLIEQYNAMEKMVNEVEEEIKNEPVVDA